MLKYFQWKTYRELYVRLMNSASDPKVLARGVALGLFVGFLMPMGLQIVVVLPLAVLLKAAKVPAIAFTFVTNQLTIFFIYPVQCCVGSYLMLSPLNYADIAAHLKGLMASPDIRTVFGEIGRLGVQLGGAFFLGGFLFGAIAGTAGYWGTYFLAVRFKKKLAERRKKREARRQSKL